MATPRVLILRAPGTNCDRETAYAFEQQGGSSDILHINRLLESPGLTDDYQMLRAKVMGVHNESQSVGNHLMGSLRRQVPELGL